MDDYKPNSYASKMEKKKEDIPEKRLEKATTGKVKVRKKNALQKFAGAFIQEDIDNVRSYIWTDVIVPKVKSLISEAGSDALNMFLFGTARRSDSGRKGLRSSINYHDPGSVRRSYDRDRYSHEDYEEIVFDSRGDAESVLDQMWATLDRYKWVRVLDYYDLAGYTPPHYTANNFGWTDLRGSAVVRISDGYIIKLPRAVPLD